CAHFRAASRARHDSAVPVWCGSRDGASLRVRAGASLRRGWQTGSCDLARRAAPSAKPCGGLVSQLAVRLAVRWRCVGR
ncbi:hypothetical protein, partial [Vibrio vulnificus]|uniref:hypothetical protein n=1 Tax=Vibrio vulnificus TaxID=672 RepID=UPI0019D465B2